MSREDINKKIEKANRQKEEIEFKVEINGETFFNAKFPSKSFYKESLKEKGFQADCYYFFKDVFNIFDEKISKHSKEQVWKKSGKKD